MGYQGQYTRLGYFSASRNIQMSNKLWDNNRAQLRALLKKLREDDPHVNQTELAKMLGRPQSYISKYENGERNLDYVEITEICRALGTSMQRFNRLYEKSIRIK